MTIKVRYTNILLYLSNRNDDNYKSYHLSQSVRAETITQSTVNLYCVLHRISLLNLCADSRLSSQQQPASLRVTRCESTTCSNSRRIKPLPRLKETLAS